MSNFALDPVVLLATKLIRVMVVKEEHILFGNVGRTAWLLLGHVIIGERAILQGVERAAMQDSIDLTVGLQQRC